jgi:hypothetical protein
MRAEGDQGNRGRGKRAPDDAAIERAVLRAVRARGAGRTICPSEPARALATETHGPDWRALMPRVRAAAARLAAQGALVATQRGTIVDAATARGPIRLGAPTNEG